jgi:methyl-accepting chemotaxis protein
MSMKSIFAAISVRSRIIGGFTMVLLLLITMAIMSDGRIREIRDNVNRIDTTTSATSLITAFADDVLVTRQLVTAYLRTTTAADLLAARDGFEATKKQTEKLAGIIGSRADALQGGFEVYRADFDAMVDNVKKRQGALSMLAANSARMTNMTLTLASEMSADGDPAAPAALRLNQDVQALVQTAYHFAATSAGTDLDIIDVEKDRIRREFAAVKASATSGAAHTSLMTAVPQQIEKLLGTTGNLLASSKAVEEDFAKLTASGTKIGKDADSLRYEYVSARSGSIADALTTAEHVLNSGITMAIGATLLAILLAALVSYSISSLIVGITRVMSGLAAGDLSLVIPNTDRRDQIGAMAQSVQVFKDNMIETARLRGEQDALKLDAEAGKKALLSRMADEFQHGVGASLDKLAKSADTMRAMSHSMSSTAEEASHQATTVAAAAEEATTNVQTVAAATEELSSSVSEIGRQVTQSTEIAAKAVAEANRTNLTVQGLSAAAQKIGDVVKLISDIASQTNLLALNATIEAARAGEAGRGFAVVANEVKSLAEKTARATEEISAQVGTMQGVTTEAVQAIESIGGTIAAINEIATTIASAVEEQGAATREIARNVQQAAQGTGQVSQTIVGVNRAAGETGTAAYQVRVSAEELNSQSDALRADVDRFIGRIRAA